jgi:hypothetical protein
VASRTATEIALTVGVAGVLGLAGIGCAPSLSTFQPAHVAPKGHLAVGAGFEGGVPVGAFGTLIDTAKLASRKAESGMGLTADEKWQVFDAGVNLVLESPSIGPHLGVSYTLIDRLELGVRYAGTAWRGGARYQILDKATAPFDLTVGAGVAHFSYEFPISDQIPILKIDDFARWQIDVPVLIGTSRDWFRVWAGPKFLIPTINEVTLASFDGHAVFFGGQGGLAIGYKRLFLAMELTLMSASGTAHVTAGVPDPNMPTTHDTNVSSFTVFPSIGLMGEI